MMHPLNRNSGGEACVRVQDVSVAVFPTVYPLIHAPTYPQPTHPGGSLETGLIVFNIY